MFDMINKSGHGNGIRMEEGTQADAYDIGGQPLFNVPLANCTAFYADGQVEDESEEEEDDDADLDGDVPEDANATVTTTGADPAAKKTKKISKRIVGYTPKEDFCLCQSWLAIIQDAISGAEQKGKAYLRG
jgi:hypothetical protein